MSDEPPVVVKDFKQFCYEQQEHKTKDYPKLQNPQIKSDRPPIEKGEETLSREQLLSKLSEITPDTIPKESIIEEEEFTSYILGYLIRDVAFCQENMKPDCPKLHPGFLDSQGNLKEYIKPTILKSFNVESEDTVFTITNIANSENDQLVASIYMLGILKDKQKYLAHLLEHIRNNNGIYVTVQNYLFRECLTKNGFQIIDDIGSKGGSGVIHPSVDFSNHDKIKQIKDEIAKNQTVICYQNSIAQLISQIKEINFVEITFYEPSALLLWNSNETKEVILTRNKYINDLYRQYIQNGFFNYMNHKKPDSDGKTRMTFDSSEGSYQKPPMPMKLQLLLNQSTSF